MKTQINFTKTAKITGLIILGILLGWLLFGGSSGEAETMSEKMAQAQSGEQANIVYTCPMHPQVRQSEPGICPFDGMELIPVNTSETEEHPQALTMGPVAMKIAEVATAPVVRKVAVKKIRLPGKVMVNKRKNHVIPAYFPGRIEELYVNFTGAYVEKGNKLASVYSPKLITAQKELLQAYRNRKTNPALYQAARQKLRNWHISAQRIDQIIQTGRVQTNFVVRAEQSGYVMELNVDEGDYIKPGQPILKLADLSSLWVVFQAYENEIQGMDVGETVQFTVAAYPGRQFEASITYIAPRVDKNTRTITVRAEVENENGLLKPHMLAKGIVSARLYEGKPVLQVPRSAVLWTSKRSIVYVKIEEAAQPTYAAREVVLGPQVGNNYVILDGLKAGQEVVVQGNFMIDAATQLAGKLSMMNREPKTGNAPRMPGMDMSGMEMNSKEMKMEQSSKNSKVDTARVPDAFIKQLDKLVDAYLKIKNALTQDDLQAAQSNVNDLKEALSAVDMSLIKDARLMKIWMTQLSALKKYIEAMEQAGVIEEFRKQFALLSSALAETLATFGVEETLYVQYCPMAEAYWISEQKTIVNPYLGQKMPGCGETKKKIKPNN